MKRKLMAIFGVMLLTAFSVFAYWPIDGQAADSLVPDATLRACINEKLGYDKNSDHQPTKEELASMTGELSCSDSGVTSLEGLQYATNLDELAIENSDLSNVSLTPISNLKNLKKLYLNNDNLSDISAISGLVNLNQLYIVGNHITDLSPIQNMKELTNLDAINNDIEDISVLEDLPNIHAVYLLDNHVYDVSYLNDKYVGTVDVENQTITMPTAVIDSENPQLSLENKIIGLDNNLIVPNKLSNNGTYNQSTGLISWSNVPLDTKQLTYNFSFSDTSEAKTTGKAFYFSGQVVQPLEWTPVIHAEDTTIHVHDTVDLAAYATASDTEDGDITSNLQFSGTVNNEVPGDYPITCTVTDSYGTTTTKTFVVHVVNDAPVIYADDVTVSRFSTFDPLDYASATDLEDGDITSNLKVIDNDVDTSKAGEYHVTYEVTDSTGATTTKTIKVTVDPLAPNLNIPPRILAKDITVEQGSTFDPLQHAAAADVEDGNITSSLVVTANDVDTSTPGEYHVTYEVTDSAGATTTKTITVTVNPAPNTPPTIDANDVTVDYGSNFDPLDYATASDKEDGDITSSLVVVSNDVDTSVPGEYNVTYEVTDSAGATTQKTIIVTVNPEPNKAPVITAKDLTIDQGSTFDPLDHAYAFDLEDGNITADLVVKENTVDTSTPGVYSVTYEVTDSAGATTDKTISVTVKALPNTPPVIEAEDVTVDQNSSFDPLDYATASDAEDGDLTADLVVTASDVDTSTPGEYHVTYQVTDSAGEMTEKTIKVTVNPVTPAPEPDTAPVIDADDVTIDANTSFDPYDYATASDAEDGDLTPDIDVIINTVDPTTAGQYVVVYEVTDSDGNTTDKEITVTVVDHSDDNNDGGTVPSDDPSNDNTDGGTKTDDTTGGTTNNTTNNTTTVIPASTDTAATKKAEVTTLPTTGDQNHPVGIVAGLLLTVGAVQLFRKK
ncbi:immunoglobulin-like domain-containing protein [Listeria costaricensis]|uniref:immunoglobulin-like domain-containing protein n=1 Tax=Listeria costaricensis TaxID=2026604 RepID=UPI000C07058A|nr:immunoglobulin-like domain-containing protein [Listeria costaricensis]